MYWGKNKPLSFMKYLTALSFVKHNPDWEIIVYYPSVVESKILWDSNEQKEYNYDDIDYFDRLSNIKNLSLRKTEFGEFSNLSEVHKSDLIRLKILSTSGGVWSDFDIFYTKSINEFDLNNTDNKLKDTFVCFTSYHSIGFLMSSGNNKFFEELYKMAIYNIKNAENLQYQNLGRDLYNYFFKYNDYKAINYSIKFNCNIANITFETVYPLQWNQIDLIFGDNKQRLPENTVGVHWFAGSPITSSVENKITEENIHLNKDKFLLKLMCELLEEI
ncbi:MAG: glycosyltransferase [Melioribacteraceae bacterium]